MVTAYKTDCPLLKRSLRAVLVAFGALLGVLTAIVVLVIIVILVKKKADSIPLPYEPPSDATLIHLFNEKQNVFEKLRKLAFTEKHTDTIGAFAEVEHPIFLGWPSARWKYKVLLQQISTDDNVVFFVSDVKDGCIEIILAAHPNLRSLTPDPASWQKGYEYIGGRCEPQPDLLVNNLDNINGLPSHGAIRKLSGRWFIHVQREIYDPTNTGV